MKEFDQNRRNSLKLFALTGTTILTMPGLLIGCQNNPEKLVRFGLITDSHYADREPVGTRYYRDSIPKMKEAIAELNKHNLDFLIHLGDFKDQNKEALPEDTLNYLKEIEAVFQQFDGPKYHALGNHDMDSITKAQFLENITNSRQQKAENYYSFEANEFHFVVLDANYDADGTDHYFAQGSDWENANIPAKEIEWLENDLQKAENPVVVFCHHPLYEFYKEGSKFHVTNYAEIQKIMQDSGKVIACMHGHVHQEDFKQESGIQFITQLGMVDYEGLKNNSFSIVTLHKKNIRIEGYRRSSDQNILIQS